MMTNMDEDNKGVMAFLAAYFSFGAIAVLAADGGDGGGDSGGIGDQVMSAVGDTIGFVIDGIQGFLVGPNPSNEIGGVMGAFIDGFQGLINAAFSILTAPVNAIVDLIQNVVSIPADFISELNPLLTGSFGATNSIDIGGTQVPQLFVAIIAIIFAGIGLGLIQASDSVGGLPVFGSAFDNLIEAIGSMFIMIGAVSIVYAMFPTLGPQVIGGGFALVMGVGILTWISNIRQGGTNENPE